MLMINQIYIILKSYQNHLIIIIVWNLNSNSLNFLILILIHLFFVDDKHCLIVSHSNFTWLVKVNSIK